jgi:hypothetical protein
MWGSGGIAPPFFTSALDGGFGPDRFTLGETAPGTHCVGSWVGPRADLGKTKCSFLTLNRNSVV